MGIKVIGSDDILEELFKPGVKNAFISLGSIGNTDIRRKIYSNLKKIGFKLPCIIDKTAIISRNIILGEGIFIGKGAIVNAAVEIGDNSIINSGAIIDHECKIGDFVHIAPGVSMSGGIVVENDVHIGTGSNIIQGVKIGKNSIVGAGSTIIRHIEPFSKVYGNPGRNV